MMPEPTAPPNAAFDVNAHSKIIASAGPTYCQLIARITMQPPKYATAMNGTSFSATLEMDFTPPKITSATAMAITSAIAQSGTPGKLDSMMPVIAADCTAEPVPMVAITAKAANATAPILAHQGTLPSERLNARSHAYIAPPSISPLWSFTRYLTDANTSQYLVAMPNTPVSHIQKTAPGPPAIMAVATPTMDPVPMVPARAVTSAPN